MLTHFASLPSLARLPATLGHGGIYLVQHGQNRVHLRLHARHITVAFGRAGLKRSLVVGEGGLHKHQFVNSEVDRGHFLYSVKKRSKNPLGVRTI